jgi:hypothetical protein
VIKNAGAYRIYPYLFYAFSGAVVVKLTTPCLLHKPADWQTHFCLQLADIYQSHLFRLLHLRNLMPHTQPNFLKIDVV